MELNGIDATLRQIADQLPKGLSSRSDVDTFQKLFEALSSQVKAAIAEASSRAGAPAATTAEPVQTPPVRTTSQLSPFQQQWLRTQGDTMLEQLPNELTAGDPQYNMRETSLRGGLDLNKIEAHLQSKARELDVEYDRSDLDGILRNSGYDAVHLGSTERYMANIEKYIGEAEKNYRQRSSNVPGRNA